MNNKRLVVAILLLVLAGLAVLTGFTKIEMSTGSVQIIIYPIAALVVVGLVQLLIYWRRTYRGR